MRRGSHPVNLALRFVLELAALVGLGFLGASLDVSGWQWVAAGALPILGAAVWGVFAVPDDPSRSGAAPVPVAGVVRLSLELVVLVLGGLGFLAAGLPIVGWGLFGLILVHYLLSVDRIGWLLTR